MTNTEVVIVKDSRGDERTFTENVQWEVNGYGTLVIRRYVSRDTLATYSPRGWISVHKELAR